MSLSPNGGTDVVNTLDFNLYHEKAGESLTINYVAAPVGGVSLDPQGGMLGLAQPANSSGPDPGLLAAVVGGAMAALMAAATLWHWRRRA